MTLRYSKRTSKRRSIKWKMAFNTDKCFTMHFTPNKSPCITPYQLCGNTLQMTSDQQYIWEWSSLGTRRKIVKASYDVQEQRQPGWFWLDPIFDQTNKTNSHLEKHSYFIIPKTQDHASTTSTIYSNSTFPWTVTDWKALPHHWRLNLNIFKAKLCDYPKSTTKFLGHPRTWCGIPLYWSI